MAVARLVLIVHGQKSGPVRGPQHQAEGHLLGREVDEAAGVVEAAGAFGKGVDE